MIIKKFTAKTEQEALDNAKRELGEGVVVMNVKDVKAKGLFSFLKPHTVEVTVALEEESEKYTAAVS
ncbi:MAG: flagellar biosynthesis protein FlhF, partial [Lachnospiraceae bacterium]|nr:flagellar biosynthesis protein FlhF [Lachnospiraceae bacterium]